MVLYESIVITPHTTLTLDYDGEVIIKNESVRSGVLVNNSTFLKMKEEVRVVAPATVYNSGWISVYITVTYLGDL